MDHPSSEFQTTLEAELIRLGSNEFAFKSEWLGYLPFGVYCWLECAGQDINLMLSEPWSRSNLDQLETASLVEKVSEYLDPADSYTVTIRYRWLRQQPS